MALFVVATPIGTLGDLSPRARDVLAGATIVYCEDTRVTRRLLAAIEREAPPLVALHAANEARLAERAARRAAVESVVLVSDAGTPGLSDPGGRLVAACHAAGVPVHAVPGPTALAAALSVAGVPAAPFTFLGFPPRKGREAWARSSLSRPETLICYEAGNRLADLLAGLARWTPNRFAVVCRELSKLHEEVVPGPLCALAASFGARDEVRGECVLVVGPGDAPPADQAPVLGDEAGLKDIADALARRWGVPRADAYRRLLVLDGAVRKDSEGSDD